MKPGEQSESRFSDPVRVEPRQWQGVRPFQGRAALERLFRGLPPTAIRVATLRDEGVRARTQRGGHFGCQPLEISLAGSPTWPMIACHDTPADTMALAADFVSLALSAKRGT